MECRVNDKQICDCLDITLLQSYIDSLGKSIVEKMIALYTQQATAYLSDIELALTSKLKAPWQQHCHKMKGAAASVGMLGVSEKLAQLETMDVNNINDSAVIEEVRHINEQAIHAFNTWLTQYK